MNIHRQEVKVARPTYLGGGEWNLRGLNSINTYKDSYKAQCRRPELSSGETVFGNVVDPA